jgi:hypothetical protein
MTHDTISTGGPFPSMIIKTILMPIRAIPFPGKPLLFLFKAVQRRLKTLGSGRNS